VVSTRTTFLLCAVGAAWCAGAPLLPANDAIGAALVVTVDEAFSARDVTVAEGAEVCTIVVAEGTPAREIPREALMLIRFAWPRADRPAAAWLELKDGRRMRGASLRLAREGATLELAAGAAPLVAPCEALAALCFDCADPAAFAPPAEGVRVVSRDGETIDAPSVTLGEEGATVQFDPSLDPVRLPRERLAAILWAGDAAPPAPGRNEVAVELRNGERRKGVLVSLGARGLVVMEGASAAVFPARAIDAMWFGAHRGARIDAWVPRAPAGPERPRWRVGKDALGGPLRLGARTCVSGLGLRAGASVAIPVPPNARFLIAYAGASADAPSCGTLTIEVLLAGTPAAALADLRPGSPARELALPLRGAGTLTVRAPAAGAAAIGCEGGLGDALFVE
jgi:hypothetical protein